MTMSDAWKNGYREGFREGYEEGKKSNWIGLGNPSVPTPSIPTKKICPACGLELSNVMGYVCANQNCPTFPRVTWATTTA